MLRDKNLIEEALYETDVNNLTYEKAEYLREVVKQRKKWFKNRLRDNAIGGPLVFCATLALNFLTGISLLSGLIGGLSSILMFAFTNLFYNSLTDRVYDKLNMTRREWRRFKKSGGIKRIKALLEEYEKSPISDLQKLENEVEKSRSQIVEAQTTEKLKKGQLLDGVIYLKDNPGRTEGETRLIKRLIKKYFPELDQNLGQGDEQPKKSEKSSSVNDGGFDSSVDADDLTDKPE